MDSFLGFDFFNLQYSALVVSVRFIMFFVLLVVSLYYRILLCLRNYRMYGRSFHLYLSSIVTCFMFVYWVSIRSFAHLSMVPYFNFPWQCSKHVGIGFPLCVSFVLYVCFVLHEMNPERG